LIQGVQFNSILFKHGKIHQEYIQKTITKHATTVHLHSQLQMVLHIKQKNKKQKKKKKKV